MILNKDHMIYKQDHNSGYGVAFQEVFAGMAFVVLSGLVGKSGDS
jgi:hypothetical protein